MDLTGAMTARSLSFFCFGGICYVHGIGMADAELLRSDVTSDISDFSVLS